MKILAVLPRFPYPLDKGDKLRAFHQLRLLSQNHDIYLFCTSEQAVREAEMDEVKKFCKEIHLVRTNKAGCLFNAALALICGGSLQVGYWNSRRTRKAYRRFEQKVQPNAVYCQMVRTMPWVRRSKCYKVLDFQDALSLNTKRRMDRSHGLMRLLLKYEYKALQKAEQRALEAFDATTVISQIDQRHLSPKTVIVPNGVDTEYFNRQAIPQSSSKYTIVFCGNMSYAPNVDAAQYLVNDVLPIVRKHTQDATLLIAGADPKAAVRSLASTNVTISGRLSDIRTAYASSCIFVAPMRIGSGLQNKLLEAMSMGLPCVTTTLANTPLGAASGESVLVGDTPQELAKIIVDLVSDSEKRERISENGLRFIKDHYSWPAAVAPLEHLFYAKLESK